MATVTLPPLVGGKASVRLVEAEHPDRQVLGFSDGQWATAYDQVALDSGASITLTPTADIAIAGGGATCYKITVTAPGQRTATYCVQVLDQEAAQPLADRVGAAGIDPASLTDWRLLPTGASDGQTVVFDASAGAWLATSVSPGSGLSDAPLTGGPYGRQSGAWVEAVGPQGEIGPPGSTGAQGPQGETGPAGAAGPGIAIGGTINQLLAKNSNTDYDTKWVDAPSGGAGATNLSVTAKTSTSLDIASDTGTDATIPAADGTYAGLLTASGYTKLSGIDSGATAAGATGDAFATSHLSAYSHGNIAHGETAYGWGNHASAGYALASSLGTAAASAATDFAPAAKGVTNGDSHDHNGGDGGQIAYSSLSGTPTLGTAAAKNIPATGNASATEVVYGSDTRLSDTRTPASHDHSSNKLTQANTHESADTDTASTALHHTLGTGANQAAAGNHTHAYLAASDVDDTPVNGETSAPVSSNWAYDHAAATVPHANQLDAAEIVLSTPSTAVTAGSKLAILTIPYAHQLSSIHFGCDAASKGSGSAVYDFNVLDSSGAATSVLTGAVTVTSSDSLIAGTLNGTVTGAANTAYSVDCDQASTGKGVKCIVTFKRTA